MIKREFKTNGDLPPYLTGNDISNYFNISRAAGYNLLHRTGLPIVRLGNRCIRLEKEDFLKWIEENTGKTK